MSESVNMNFLNKIVSGKAQIAIIRSISTLSQNGRLDFFAETEIIFGTVQYEMHGVRSWSLKIIVIYNVFVTMLTYCIYIEKNILILLAVIFL